MKANINNPIIFHPSISLEDIERKQNKKLNTLSKLFLNKVKERKNKNVIITEKEIFIYQ